MFMCIPTLADNCIYMYELDQSYAISHKRFNNYFAINLRCIIVTLFGIEANGCLFRRVSFLRSIICAGDRMCASMKAKFYYKWIKMNVYNVYALLDNCRCLPDKHAARFHERIGFQERISGFHS